MYTGRFQSKKGFLKSRGSGEGDALIKHEAVLAGVPLAAGRTWGKAPDWGSGEAHAGEVGEWKIGQEGPEARSSLIMIN